jgi:hypothetical protein
MKFKNFISTLLILLVLTANQFTLNTNLEDNRTINLERGVGNPYVLFNQDPDPW